MSWWRETWGQASFVWLCWELNPECVRFLFEQPEIQVGWDGMMDGMVAGMLSGAGWERLVLLLSVRASPFTAGPLHRPRTEQDARLAQCSSRGIDKDGFSIYFL